MRVRRVIIPTLTLIAIMASTAPTAFAMTPVEATDILDDSQTVVMEIAEVDAITSASPQYVANADGTYSKVVYASNNSVEVSTVDKSIQGTEFNDLNGYEWAAPAIKDLAAKGIVKGVGAGKFDPGSNVTRQEFVIMSVRAFGDDLGKLAEQANNLQAVERLNGDYWANEAISASKVFGLNGTFGDAKEDWSLPATRGEMAYICMTIAEQLGDEQFTVKDGIENNIGDYNIVSASGYKNNILKAYSNGILVGINDKGDYGTMNNAKRAEAAVIIKRLIDPSSRETVEVKAPEVVVPPIQEGENVGQYATYPKEGDVINGVTVTRDPVTGVLGFGNGQKGGIYLGVTLKSDTKTKVIQVGSMASENYDNMHFGDTYEQRHGMTFWSSEWGMIDRAAEKKLPDPTAATLGQKADIHGNIITSGDAYWECTSVFEGYYEWSRI